jgi:hypothetical protein
LPRTIYIIERLQVIKGVPIWLSEEAEDMILRECANEIGQIKETVKVRSVSAIDEGLEIRDCQAQSQK